MPKKKQGDFSHYADHPVKMAEKAIRDLARAPRGEVDNVQVRQAAELGWLAASSAADKIARTLGRAEPHGYNARQDALEDVGQAGGLRSAQLVANLAAAKSTLHGECYYGNTCDVKGMTSILKEQVLPLAQAAEDFEADPPKRLRKRK